MTLLTDHAGKISSNRAVAVWAWGLFGVCWAYASIKAGTVAEIPESALVLLGLATGGNLGNRYLNERPAAAKEAAP
jgi:hypothetical protein